MSPVIGAIMMVAITVIMAAAIGSVVFDYGGSVRRTAPQAALDVSLDADADYVNVSHRGGDGLDAARTRVVVTNEADGSRQVFGPADDASVLVVGEAAALDTDAGLVTSSPWDGMTADGGEFAIVEGVRYSVQVVDTRSHRVVFETALTA